MSTAYLLSECKASDKAGRPLNVQVHLLDRSNAIGMDTASLSIKSDTEETYRVDVPMRSINGGSHGRVRKLYQHLGIPLVRSDFSYSFSRLAAPSSSSSPPPPPPPPPARPDADASDVEEEEADEPPSPPPAYSEATESSRPPTPSADSDSDSDSKPAAAPARPSQSTSLLYQGASGLRWPPLSLPSRFHSSSTSLGEKVAYLAETAFLALSYLYLLALAFFYVSLGLSRPASTTRNQSRPSSFERFGIANVAAVPLGEFCEKHRVPRQMVDKVLIPLMAAVATVGVDQARRMPTGEVLDYIVDTFAHSHYVTDPSVGVRGIVRRLVAPVPPAQIHLGIEITRIEALVAQPDAAYRIHYHRHQESGSSERVLRTLEVDHVVFATQADQAARLLSTLGSSGSTTMAAAAAVATEEVADSLKKEAIRALQAFTYVRTLVVTHRDQSVLPADGKDRRDLNLAVFEPSISCPGGPVSVAEQQDWDESLDYLPPSSVQTTHIISPLRQPWRAYPSHPTADSKAHAPTAAAPAYVLQTTNPIVPIDAKHVLSSTWFSRAFATAESQAVLGRFLLSSTSSPSPSSSSTPSSSSSSSSLQGRSLGHPTTSSSTATTATTGGVWFVGSYVATGFPLLEGCVSSAENVVRALVRQERASFDGPWLF